MATKQKIVIVGATGAVGQTTLRILEERRFPVRELRAFACERSAGKTLTFKGESIRVEKLGPDAFKGADFAFFYPARVHLRAPQASRHPLWAKIIPVKK